MSTNRLKTMDMVLLMLHTISICYIVEILYMSELSGAVSLHIEKVVKEGRVCETEVLYRSR